MKTRESFKLRVFTMALSVAAVLSMMTVASAAVSKPSYVYDPARFTDISGHWAQQSLSNAARNGVMTGTTTTTMSPDVQLTRAQMAAMLVRIFEPTERANLFQYVDLNPGAWYYDSISRAVAMGIMQGSGNTMSPDRPISRQEACQLLYNAFHLQKPSGIAIGYSDASSISAWAYDAVVACSAAGAIRSTDGMIHPTDTITRAEFASMIYSLVQSFETSQVNSITTQGVSAIISNGSGRYNNINLSGNLYLADGIGRNDLSFSNTAINGYLLVRGGREIYLLDNSVASQVVVEGAVNNVTITTDSSTVVGELVVKECKGTVTLQGNFNRVIIASDTPVYIERSFVQELKIDITTVNGVLVNGSGKPDVTIDPYTIVENFARDKNIKDEDGHTYEELDVIESSSKFDIVGDIYISGYNPLKLEEAYGLDVEDFVLDMTRSVDSKKQKITIGGTLKDVSFGGRNKYSGYYFPIRLMVKEFAEEFDVYVNDTKMLSSKDFEDDCIRLNLLIPFSSYYRTAEIRFEPVRGTRYDAVTIDVAVASGTKFR